MIPELLETVMLLCFLAAWPISAVRAYRSGTARGTSLMFMLVIEAGYVCGMAGKICSGSVNFVLFFYAVNFCVVMVNIALYFRNRKLDAVREESRLFRYEYYNPEKSPFFLY